MCDASATCDVCSARVPPHEHFLVRIDVFADPTMPDIHTDEPEHANIAQTIDDLLEQMKLMTSDELQDGVHRRFEYRLCPTCHKRFLANPLGLPRRRRDGDN